jgi:hypothetical protein
MFCVSDRQERVVCKEHTGCGLKSQEGILPEKKGDSLILSLRAYNSVHGILTGFVYIIVVLTNNGRVPNADIYNLP